MGLSVGIYCVAYCAPFVASVVATQIRSKKEDARVIAEFIVGRFFGYVAFGALFGYLGSVIGGPAIKLFADASLIVLSLLLMVQAAGLIWQKSGLCLVQKKIGSRLPFVMGFLMGVNVCPPFLMSLAYVLTLGTALKGAAYFMMFFLGSSVYFIPLFFFREFNKKPEIQRAARVAAFLAGIMFLGYGAYSLAAHFHAF